jgi:hypothetical protein
MDSGPQAIARDNTNETWKRQSLAAGFFDHLLRNRESYDEKWEYVRNNPPRAGLVKFRDDWPYQGEIASIDRV